MSEISNEDRFEPRDTREYTFHEFLAFMVIDKQAKRWLAAAGAVFVAALGGAFVAGWKAS